MKTVLERFKEKVIVVASGCHEWTGRIQPNGYGQFRLNGKTQYAHRASYEIHSGKAPQGHVMHSCDNRKCVNPAHLSDGTRADNMSDMVKKVRQAAGMKNRHAKLTDDQVREIRAASGTTLEIAQAFGVSQPLVSMIRTRRIWRHI